MAFLTFSSVELEYLAGDDVLECDPEVDVEDGVDDRVQGGVDVAQPGDELDNLEIKGFLMHFFLFC